MDLTQSGINVLDMSEDQKNSVLAGVPMIEARAFIGQHKTRPKMGMINVTTRIDMSTGQPRPMVTWLTGNMAVTKMESDKNGVGISYFPDDPWWINRIKLINKESVIRIHSVHTDKGTIPGSVLEQQIALLEKRLREDVPIFRILENGIPKSDRYSREEAENELESFNMIQTAIDARTGQMKPVNLNKNIYKIVEITGRAFKPEIKDMIKKYRNLPDGWTSCQEFREIQKEIREQFAAMQEPVQEAPKTFADMLKEMSGSLSPAEKKALLKSVLGGEEEPDEKPKKPKKPEKPETVEA